MFTATNTDCLNINYKKQPTSLKLVWVFILSTSHQIYFYLIYCYNSDFIEVKAMYLNQVSSGQNAKIVCINSPDDIKRRLMEFGMIEGEQIKPVLKAPSGEPTAYEIKGALIALRSDTASAIEVEVAKE